MRVYFSVLPKLLPLKLFAGYFLSSTLPLHFSSISISPFLSPHFCWLSLYLSITLCLCLFSYLSPSLSLSFPPSPSLPLLERQKWLLRSADSQ